MDKVEGISEANLKLRHAAKTAFAKTLAEAASGESDVSPKDVLLARRRAEASGVTSEEIDSIIHDRSKRSAIALDGYEPDPAPARMKLSVPFEDKGEAHLLGAKWSVTQKTWYIEIGADIKKFKKWIAK